MSVVIASSRVASLANVARDIAFVAQQHGLQPVLIDYHISASQIRKLGNHLIVVMAFNPLVSTSWMLLVRDSYIEGVPAVFYATVEGFLPSYWIKKWMKTDFPIIANSNFTYNILLRAGLPVIDKVLHGYNPEDIRIALKYHEMSKKLLERRVGKGKVLGVVASGHPRKGHHRFKEVVKKVVEKNKEVKFYILTDESGAKHYQGIPHVYTDTSFGKRLRTEVLAMISAFDFLVQPSLCEGFSLPVLEANAMGVPVIHLAYEPIIEFSDEKANIYVPYERTKKVRPYEGIEYFLHLYDPEVFAERILQAVSMSKEEYQERCERAKESVKHLNVLNLYPKLLKFVKAL